VTRGGQSNGSGLRSGARLCRLPRCAGSSVGGAAAAAFRLGRRARQAGCAAPPTPWGPTTWGPTELINSSPASATAGSSRSCCGRWGCWSASAMTTSHVPRPIPRVTREPNVTEQKTRDVVLSSVTTSLGGLGTSRCKVCNSYSSPRISTTLGLRAAFRRPYPYDGPKPTISSPRNLRAAFNVPFGACLQQSYSSPHISTQPSKKVR
jgi:hypothetical protein